MSWRDFMPLPSRDDSSVEECDPRVEWIPYDHTKPRWLRIHKINVCLGSIAVCGGLTVIVAIFLSWLGLLSWPWTTKRVTIVLVTGALIGVAQFVWEYFRKIPLAVEEYREALRRLSLPWESFRVRCMGKCHDYRAIAAVSDQAFEPYVFSVHLTWIGVRGAAILAWFPGMLMLVMIVAMNTIVHRNMLLAVPVALSFVLLFRLDSWMKPMYYRVLPGRLDIMRFWFWSDKAHSVRSIVLRDARVILRTDVGRVEVIHTGDDGASRTQKVPYMGIEDVPAFARAIVRATLTEAPTPPIPRDQLLG